MQRVVRVLCRQANQQNRQHILRHLFYGRASSWAPDLITSKIGGGQISSCDPNAICHAHSVATRNYGNQSAARTWKPLLCSGPARVALMREAIWYANGRSFQESTAASVAAWFSEFKPQGCMSLGFELRVTFTWKPLLCRGPARVALMREAIWYASGRNFQEGTAASVAPSAALMAASAPSANQSWHRRNTAAVSCASPASRHLLAKHRQHLPV